MNKWFENLRISRKLISGFLVVVLLSVIVGGSGIFGILQIRNSDAKLYQEDTCGLEIAGNTAVEFMMLRYNSVKRIYAADQAEIEELVGSIEENIANIDSLLEQCRNTVSDSDIQTFLGQLTVDWDTYKQGVAKENETALAGKTVEYDENMATLGNTLRDEFSSLFDKISVVAADKADGNSVSAGNFAIALFILVVFAAVFAILIARYISRGISKPMQVFAAFAEMLAVGDVNADKVASASDRLLYQRKDEIGRLAGAFDRVIISTTEQAQKARAIANGDLTTSITVRSEHDLLGKALAELVDKFHNLAASIVSSADQVDSGSKQVADSSTSLSQGATEQASSVEELSASMEELTSHTTQNAQNAQKTNDLAESIQRDAVSGNAQMMEMLRAMEEINSSSDNIRKINKVIEDIAFQTNILALNAAVEAARAGQYGKGFAVVAEEVRNLAAQSSKAAKETTDLIDNSIHKVESGTKIAKETAGALSKIVEGITKVTELISAIDSASGEQSAALEQINMGILQVSQIVQSNAAAAEECAAVSEELSSQADSLKSSVSVFKLSTGSVPGTNGYTQKPAGISLDKFSGKSQGAKAQSAAESGFGKY